MCKRHIHPRPHKEDKGIEEGRQQRFNIELKQTEQDERKPIKRERQHHEPGMYRMQFQLRPCKEDQGKEEKGHQQFNIEIVYTQQEESKPGKIKANCQESARYQKQGHPRSCQENLTNKKYIQ